MADIAIRLSGQLFRGLCRIKIDGFTVAPATRGVDGHGIIASRIKLPMLIAQRPIFCMGVIGVTTGTSNTRVASCPVTAVAIPAGGLVVLQCFGHKMTVTFALFPTAPVGISRMTGITGHSRQPPLEIVPMASRGTGTQCGLGNDPMLIGILPVG